MVSCRLFLIRFLILLVLPFLLPVACAVDDNNNKVLESSPPIYQQQQQVTDFDVLWLMRIPDTLIRKHKAYCLDGSPYKYYLRRTPFAKQHGTDYVFYFQGGGWCYNETECVERSKTSLGSSTRWVYSISAPTLLKKDSYLNPLFAAYNHVFLPYCDGASFSGNHHGPISVNTTTTDADGNITNTTTEIWLRGLHNLNAVLENLGFLHTPLVSLFTDKTVDNFVISGCSAGGLSTYLHADYIRQVILENPFNSKARIKAIAECGLFLFHDTVRGQAVYEMAMKHVFEMQNSSRGVNQACIQDSSERQYKCISAMTSLQYIETPIFMFNSIYDSWALQCILTSEPGHQCAAIPDWEPCVTRTDLDKCTTPQRLQLWEWGNALLQQLINTGILSRNDFNGAFLHSCFTHCSIDHHLETINTLEIQGTTLGQAISKWWHDNGGGGVNDDNLQVEHQYPSALPRSHLRRFEPGPPLGHPHLYWPCRIRPVGPAMCNPTCQYINHAGGEGDVGGCVIHDDSSITTSLLAPLHRQKGGEDQSRANFLDNTEQQAAATALY